MFKAFLSISSSESVSLIEDGEIYTKDRSTKACHSLAHTGVTKQALQVLKKSRADSGIFLSQFLWGLNEW